MATCSKRKVSFFIRDILCAESSNHVTSSNIVTSLNDVTSVADDTQTLRHSEDRKGRETKTVSERGNNNNVTVNSHTVSTINCHIISSNGGSNIRTISNSCLSNNNSNGNIIHNKSNSGISSNNINNYSSVRHNNKSNSNSSSNNSSINSSSNSSNSNSISSNNCNNSNNNNNSNSSSSNSSSSSSSNSNTNNSNISSSNSNNKSSSSRNNNNNNNNSKDNIDCSIFSNNSSSNNQKDNNIPRINHIKLKENNNVNTKTTSLQQQQQQQQQQLPVPIPLVAGHHWPPLSSAQRLPLLPTSGSGECLPVCTWGGVGGVRASYLYPLGAAHGRGLGPLVPGAAPPAAGLHPLPLPGRLPPVSAPPGGGYGRVYGGGEGRARCAGGGCVYRCGCASGDMATSSPLSHPGLQYLGGPIPYPPYSPPVSRPSVPVPIPLPVYLRTRASPNNDGNTRPRKCRRSRTVFSELQLMGLERRFDDQKYLSTPDRGELARTLGLTQVQVKTWYQNRRMKWKKQVLQGGATEPPTKPKGRPRKEQQHVVTMDTTASSAANQHSDTLEVTCHDVTHVNMSTGEENDVHCETGSDSDGDDVMNDVCDVGSDVDSDIESDIDVQIT